MVISTKSKKAVNSKTKYKLFFNEVVHSKGDFNPNLYSKSKHIAELDVLSIEEIKTSWLGFFNINTQKIETDWNITWNIKGHDNIIYLNL